MHLEVWQFSTGSLQYVQKEMLANFNWVYIIMEANLVPVK